MITQEMCEQKLQEAIDSLPQNRRPFEYRLITLQHNHGYIYTIISEPRPDNYTIKNPTQIPNIPFTPMPSEYYEAQSKIRSDTQKYIKGEISYPHNIKEYDTIGRLQNHIYMQIWVCQAFGKWVTVSEDML